MTNKGKRVIAILGMVILLLGASMAFLAIKGKADEASAAEGTQLVAEADAAQESSALGSKAIAAGVAIGLGALGGAIGMGMAISKSSEGISRQPEAEGKIRTTLMLGLVFIETAIIYALVVAILIIFVL